MQTNHTEKDARFIILHSAFCSEIPNPLIQKNTQPWKWIYLGRKYKNMCVWEEKMPPHCSKLPISERLEKTAHALKEPFIAAVARMGLKYNSIAWWVSRFSERNITVSPLFLYCCYLRLALDIIEKSKDNICIIAENDALLVTLQQNLEVTHKHCTSQVIFTGRKRICQTAARFLGGLFFLVWKLPRAWLLFLRWGLKNKKDAAATKQSVRDGFGKFDKPRVLLHTFVDETCFGANGVFNERYWGRLPTWLQEQGYDVMFLPYLYNIRRTVREAYAWMRESTVQFCIPEDYYSLFDYCKTLPHVLRQLFIPRGKVMLGELNITPLVRDEKISQALGRRVPQCLMYYYLVKKIAAKRIRVDYFFHTFENQIWEKALIAGFRKYFPHTPVIGFQHTSFSPFFLGYFIPSTEVAIAPLDNYIITNGDFFREKIVAAGFPADRVKTGCSLRYEYFNAFVQSTLDAGQHLKMVLVGLPLEEDSAIELLYKIYFAFKDTPDLTVLIKPHPMMDSKPVQEVLPCNELPEHMRIADGRMHELLSQAGVFITNGSTSAFEAMAFGVPVLRVGREAELDFDPLTWFEDYRETCHSPEEIRCKVRKFLSLKVPDRVYLLQRNREILNRCFAPVSDDRLQCFLPDV